MLKKIVLYGPATDNAGHYRDAGAELTIGKAAKAKTISLERAQELIGRGGAASATAAAADEQAAEDAGSDEGGAANPVDGATEAGQST
jgi:general stress protein YciG